MRARFAVVMGAVAASGPVLALQDADVLAEASVEPQKQDLSRNVAPRSGGQRVLSSYPSRALREGAEGSVQVLVTVSNTGLPTDCQVIASSGHASLDEAACQNMLRYARFDPALNRSGKPIPSKFTTIVTYRLSQPADNPQG